VLEYTWRETLFRQLTNICHKIKYYVRSLTNATSRMN